VVFLLYSFIPLSPLFSFDFFFVSGYTIYVTEIAETEAEQKRRHYLNLWRYAAAKRRARRTPEQRAIDNTKLKEYRTAHPPTQEQKLAATVRNHKNHCFRRDLGLTRRTPEQKARRAQRERQNKFIKVFTVEDARQELQRAEAHRDWIAKEIARQERDNANTLAAAEPTPVETFDDSEEGRFWAGMAAKRQATEARNREEDRAYENANKASLLLDADKKVAAAKMKLGALTIHNL